MWPCVSSTAAGRSRYRLDDLVDPLLGILTRVDDQALRTRTWRHQIAVGGERAGREPRYQHSFLLRGAPQHDDVRTGYRRAPWFAVAPVVRGRARGSGWPPRPGLQARGPDTARSQLALRTHNGTATNWLLAGTIREVSQSAAVPEGGQHGWLERRSASASSRGNATGAERRDGPSGRCGRGGGPRSASSAASWSRSRSAATLRSADPASQPRPAQPRPARPRRPRAPPPRPVPPPPPRRSPSPRSTAPTRRSARRPACRDPAR